MFMVLLYFCYSWYSSCYCFCFVMVFCNINVCYKSASMSLEQWLPYVLRVLHVHNWCQTDYYDWLLRLFLSPLSTGLHRLRVIYLKEVMISIFVIHHSFCCIWLPMPFICHIQIWARVGNDWWNESVTSSLFTKLIG